MQLRIEIIARHSLKSTSKKERCKRGIELVIREDISSGS